MSNLDRQPGESQSDYGWRLLRHDLNRSKVPLEQTEQQTYHQGAPVTNIVNYPPQQLRYGFSTWYTTVVVIIVLLIAFLLLIRCGFFSYLLGWLM